jgi:hypothetical protein
MAVLRVDGLAESITEGLGKWMQGAGVVLAWHGANWEVYRA